MQKLLWATCKLLNSQNSPINVWAFCNAFCLFSLRLNLSACVSFYEDLDYYFKIFRHDFYGMIMGQGSRHGCNIHELKDKDFEHYILGFDTGLGFQDKLVFLSLNTSLCSFIFGFVNQTFCLAKSYYTMQNFGWTLARGSELFVEQKYFKPLTLWNEECSACSKQPTQDFFISRLGFPITMNPNFEDLSCEMRFGEHAVPFQEDPIYSSLCRHAKDLEGSEECSSDIFGKTSSNKN